MPQHYTPGPCRWSQKVALDVVDCELEDFGRVVARRI